MPNTHLLPPTSTPPPASMLAISPASASEVLPSGTITPLSAIAARAAVMLPLIRDTSVAMLIFTTPYMAASSAARFCIAARSA